MGMLGFPDAEEMASMMGFVTDEDRDRWKKQKAASDERMESARNGLSARQLASQSAAPAIGLAEKAINAQMTSASIEQRRGTLKKQTNRRTVTTFETEEPVVSDEPGMGF